MQQVWRKQKGARQNTPERKCEATTHKGTDVGSTGESGTGIGAETSNSAHKGKQCGKGAGDEGKGKGYVQRAPECADAGMNVGNATELDRGVEQENRRFTKVPMQAAPAQAEERAGARAEGVCGNRGTPGQTLSVRRRERRLSGALWRPADRRVAGTLKTRETRNECAASPCIHACFTCSHHISVARFLCSLGVSRRCENPACVARARIRSHSSPQHLPPSFTDSFHPSVTVLPILGSCQTYSFGAFRCAHSDTFERIFKLYHNKKSFVCRSAGVRMYVGVRRNMCLILPNSP